MTKTPLYVLVDEKNVARDTADSMDDARAKRNGCEDTRFIKLFADHKGDKSLIGF